MSRVHKSGLSFGIGAAVGTAGGLIGLGGAEFRLPALVGALGFTARQAVPVNLLCSFLLAVALRFAPARCRSRRSGRTGPPSSGCLPGR